MRGIRDSSKEQIYEIREVGFFNSDNDTEMVPSALLQFQYRDLVKIEEPCFR